MKIFTDEERRGLMVLLPLIMVVVLLSVLAERRDNGPLLLGDEPSERSATEAETVSLTPFDPNEPEYEELRRCGVPTVVAAGIVRWRRYGKVYRIREDLATVTGMNDSIYAVLKPYIVISEHHAATPSRKRTDYPTKATDRIAAPKPIELEPFAIDTVSAAWLAGVGFSPRQAEVLIRYRDASEGIRTEEQLRRCYVVSDEMAERLLPYVIFTPPKLEPEKVVVAAVGRPLVEINSADSATLRSVAGIGERTVSEMIRYRELLGGYSCVEQIAELECVTESNYEKILTQICCDSCKISKIDINFADPKELMRHPYVSAKALRRIVKQRKLKGGWSGIEEMIEDDIFTREEAERMAPYLRFGPYAP